MAGNWISLSELARRRGVTRQSISLSVKRLTRAGALKTRPGPRGTLLIDLREYEANTGLAVPAPTQPGAPIKRGESELKARKAGDLLRQALGLAGEAARLVLADLRQWLTRRLTLN